MEVQAQAWERFQAEWSKYTEALKQQPEFWRKIAAQHEKLASGFGQYGAKFDAHLDALQDAQSLQDDSEKSLTHSAALWGGIEKASSSTAKSIISGTTSLLKWSGLLAGVGSLLGYFSIDGMMHLGANVAGQRKSAMGLGLSIGQQRAFDLAFGPVLSSPQGFLGGVNTALSDISSQNYTTLASLRVNPNGSTSEVGVALLKKIYALAQATPRGLLVPSMETPYNLGNYGIGSQDLELMHQMKPSEFNHWLEFYQKQQKTQNVTDRTARGWTEFLADMKAAGGEINNVFVTGLKPLEKPLAGLADGFAHMLKVGMGKNGFIEKDINSIAGWMNSFNGEITKPKFLSGLQNFVDSVATIGDAMNATLHPLRTTGHLASDSWWAFKNMTGWHGIAANHGLVINNPGNLKFAGQPGATPGPGGFAQFPTMDAGVAAMAQQFELYNARGINTVQSIIEKYAPASDGNDVPAYIKNIDKYLGVSATQHLNLGNAHVLAELVRAVIKQELGTDSGVSSSTISRAARDATSRVGITVQDRTSLGVTAQIAALGAQR